SMQGHYKYTDGFSDSSSVGSFMDETDREVSSLTDRAFRSLCIGDEAIYNDADFSSPPAGLHRTFIEDNQSQELLKESAQERYALAVKRYTDSEKTSEVAATFQQSVSEKTKQEQVCKNDAVLHLSNGSIGTAWPQRKNASKVSSLIKAFDIVENATDNSMNADSKQSTACTANNNYNYRENSCESWDKSALLSIQRELSEFSDAYQQNFISSTKSAAGDNWKKAGQFPPPRNHFHSSEVRAAQQSSDRGATVPSTKHSKTKSSRSSKGKKLSLRNSFLHSEYSPFQSWKDYKRYPFDTEEVADLLSSDEIPRWYDSPLYKELTAAHRTQTPQTGDRKTHRRHTDDMIPAEVPGSTVLQKALSVEKRCESEMGANCAPWRKHRNLITNKPPLHRPCTVSPQGEKSRHREEGLCPPGKVPPGHQRAQTLVAEQTAHAASPPFNISKLLTPVIHARQETETSEILQCALSPPVIDLKTLAEPEVRPVPEHKFRDSYKAMASSLLFNLKDNRKRVKSKYSPTTFKSQEVHDRNKQPSKQEMLLLHGVGTAGHLKARDIPSVTSPVLQTINMQSADRKYYADACISDDYLTLSSPHTVKEAANYKCFSAAAQESAVSTDQPAESQRSRFSDSQVVLSPRSHEITSRKRPDYPSLKLYRKENTKEEEVKEQVATVKRPLQSTATRDKDNAGKPVQSLINKKPEAPNFSLQDNGIKPNPTFSLKTSNVNPKTKSPKEPQLLADQNLQTIHDEDVKVEFASWNLSVSKEKKEETEDKAEEGKKEVDKSEVQYYALSNHEGESERKARPESSPQRRERTPPKEETEISPRGLEEGGWVHCLIDYAKAYTPVPISNAPSPSLTKLNMFKIKDNTFRTSPVIKAVKPPLHKTFPEELQLTAPRERVSNPEKIEEQGVAHSPEVQSEAPGVNEIPVLDEVPVPEPPQNENEVPCLGEDPGAGKAESPLGSNSAPKEDESQAVVNAVSEDVESCVASSTGAEEKAASAANVEETEGSKDVSERSDSVCSASENKPLGKPPAVPPKTEKALRRAKKLTNRRRKVDTKPKADSNAVTDKKPIRAVSSTPSSPACLLSSPLPGNPVSSASPAQPEPSYVPPAANVVTLKGAQSLQPFPLTQRKLLQDPESGQYFVVDMPVQVKTKTFFDPETGKYVQLSIRSTEGGLSHASSVEVLNTPSYVLYPGFLPLPVTTLPTLRSSSQMSAPAALMDDPEKLRLSEAWAQEVLKQKYNRENQPYIEPACESLSQVADDSAYSEGKTSVSPRNLDIISMSELEDFAVESVS
uniref:Chromosome 10 open reading frame 71 n=1 Tax=Lepisosteus oculatus TaxID=7918 RepID=W5M963_LEPOC